MFSFSSSFSRALHLSLSITLDVSRMVCVLQLTDYLLNYIDAKTLANYKKKLALCLEPFDQPKKITHTKLNIKNIAQVSKMKRVSLLCRSISVVETFEISNT